VLAVVSASLSPTAAAAADCWHPPVSAEVADPFRPPACRWCPGNRGLEYATQPGDEVRAVGAGEVSFSGKVAGTVYVVVRHADGLRVSYGRLTDTSLSRGDVVVAGALVGHADVAFHLGVRDGETYLDPSPLIGELRTAVRLVPTDGGASRPAPAPTLTCPAQVRTAVANG
jgi:murein DD-endopeptidase MepM/ murein hydrolase activator NlpD